ncbi:MAG TPA: phage/plasmid primase, P4 family [Thermoplasmata archaeon]|nr:phage/plasmid primase, P4 family [Thermoplasmata archaeon]
MTAQPGSDNGSIVAALRAKGYFLLPLPARSKEPPPKGWVEHREPYDIPAGGNLAIGVRGDAGILITNDGESTAWARGKYGAPNVRSMRGAHWYFHVTDGQDNLANRPTPVGTMELHVRNKYALVPPSIHPVSGLPYEWERPLPPVADLPPCPDLRELWRSCDPEPSEGDVPPILDDVARAVAPFWRRGVRWMLTKAIAGFARKWLNLHEPGARRLVQSIADLARDTDPLDREDKIGYTYRLDLPRVGVAYWCREAGAPELADQLFRLIQPAARAALTPLWTDHGSKDRPDWDAHRPGFVAHVMDEMVFATPTDDRAPLVYRDGVYVPAAAAVDAWVEAAFRAHNLGDGRPHGEETSSTNFRREVLGSVGARSQIDRSLLDPPGLLCLANGVLDTRTLEVRPHAPVPRFTVKLPVAYDPVVGCPAFDRFLERVVPDLATRSHLLEWMGYLLEDGYPHQFALCLNGPGANGKTTFIAVLTALLGGAFSSETLQALANNRFASSSLQGKLANLCDDLPATELGDVGRFKMLTGGSPIAAEKKGTPSFVFINRAKMIFTSNRLPRVNPDQESPAFWRRIQVVDFGVVIPTAEQVHDLSALLAAELPGIFNHALRGLRRLRERGRFDIVPTIDESTATWHRLSDSLRWFVDEGVDRDREGVVPKDVFMSAYARFCAENDATPLAANIVGAQLPQLLPGVRAARHRVDDRMTKVWLGLRLCAGVPGVPGGCTQDGLKVTSDGGSVDPPYTPSTPGTKAGNWSINGEPVE